jgi:peptidylprolyl isomerase
VKTRSRLLPVLAAAALSLSACGDGEQPPERVAAASPEAAETCPDAPELSEPPADASDDLQSKPTIEVPKTPPPTELQVSDIVVGEGELACAGDFVSMQYVGVTYADGKQFDASWDRGQPFEFELGGGQVIGGWDQGIVGMKQGGRRQLVIPPDLGYGDQGAPPAIPPGATLVFVVDLVGVGG